MKLPKVPHANCASCPLIHKPIAPSIGRLDAPVALISRSPGKWDTSSGVPFSGPSGKVLDYLLEKYGSSRDDVFITNVVLCLTDNLDPKAVECCSPRLNHEIDTLVENGVKTIIAGGSEATEWLLGDAAVKKYRGRRVPINQGRTDIVVTFNPAAALHQPATFPDLEADIRRALQPPKPFVEPTIHWTNDRTEAGQFIEHLSGYQLLAGDIEATGLSQFSSLVSIGFAGSSTEGFVFGQDLVSDHEWIHSLRCLLEDRHISWHNGKYDAKVLKGYGINPNISTDTLLMSYMLDERPGVHSLDYCLQNYLGWPYYTPPEVAWGKKNGFRYKEEYYDACMQLVYKYNGMDAVGGFQLHEYLSEQLKQESSRYEVRD